MRILVSINKFLIDKVRERRPDVIAYSELNDTLIRDCTEIYIDMDNLSYLLYDYYSISKNFETKVIGLYSKELTTGEQLKFLLDGFHKVINYKELDYYLCNKKIFPFNYKLRLTNIGKIIYFDQTGILTDLKVAENIKFKNKEFNALSFDKVLSRGSNSYHCFEQGSLVTIGYGRYKSVLKKITEDKLLPFFVFITTNFLRDPHAFKFNKDKDINSKIKNFAPDLVFYDVRRHPPEAIINQVKSKLNDIIESYSFIKTLNINSSSMDWFETKKKKFKGLNDNIAYTINDYDILSLNESTFTIYAKNTFDSKSLFYDGKTKTYLRVVSQTLHKQGYKIDLEIAAIDKSSKNYIKTFIGNMSKQFLSFIK